MILNPLTIRYSLDTPTLYGITCTGAMPSHYALARGLAQHVRVGPHVLPTLHTAARKVETRLGLTAELSVFVYASPEINAYVCPDATEQRILVFVSSTLLTSLSPEEWLVVLGHEVGHHIYGHHHYPRPSGSEHDLRILDLMRASEISADRAALLASDDLDTTLRAMLKITSGLNEDLLEVNIADYTRQIAELRELGGCDQGWLSSHPPFPVRVRAAIRCDTLLREAASGGDATALLPRIDDDVTRDLWDSVSGQNAAAFHDDSATAAFWHAAQAACKDGRFSTREQAAMAAVFGEQRVSSLKSMMKHASSIDEALQLISERHERAWAQLRTAPLAASKHCERILSRLSREGIRLHIPKDVCVPCLR